METNVLKYDNDGLIPAIIQNKENGKVLMLGFMNAEALHLTIKTNFVTFFSRSRQEIWLKGQTSGNRLILVSIDADCDNDTLLVKVKPEGPTCHTGQETCWQNNINPEGSNSFLDNLAEIIKKRRNSSENTSYVKSLFTKGLNKIAQKVGEEASETVIEALVGSDDSFLNESADLLFHLLLLLEARDLNLNDVVSILKKRNTSYVNSTN